MATENTWAQLLQVPTALAALGLAYQIAFWSEFSVNVFSYAKLSDLIPMAISPLLIKTLILLPSIVWLLSAALLILGLIRLYIRLRQIKGTPIALGTRLRVLAIELAPPIMSVVGLASTAMFAAPSAPGTTGLDLWVESDKYFSSIIWDTLVPASILVVNGALMHQVIHALSLGRWIRDNVNQVLLALFVLALGGLLAAGSLDASEAKRNEWGTTLVVFNGMTLYRYSYGRTLCLTSIAVREIETRALKSLPKDAIDGRRPAILLRLAGRIGDTVFLFDPDNSRIYMNDAKDLNGLPFGVCSAVRDEMDDFLLGSPPKK
jgi:hypothetical protein